MNAISSYARIVDAQTPSTPMLKASLSPPSAVVVSQTQSDTHNAHGINVLSANTEAHDEVY